MTSPPVFEPYVLSPLDHMTGPIHLSVFLTFHPEHPHEAILALETGILRLISLLPFLSGNVALSSQLQGKNNVREVQPATAEFLREHPLLKVTHHSMSISPLKSGPTISRDTILNEEFVPIPFAMAMDDLIPIFRAKANVMQDGIIICFSFYHMVLDGFGFCNAMKSLADCCRSPSLTSLATDPCKEAQTRRTIFEARLDSNAQQQAHSHFFGNYSFEQMPNTSPESPITRIFTLDAARVESLQNACNAMLRCRSDTQNVYLSKNHIITSLMWLCSIRSRYSSQSIKNHSENDTIPEKSYITTIVDVRKVLQLPLSYMGNAVLCVQTFTGTDAMLSPPAQSSEPAAATEHVNSKDVEILAELSHQAHGTIQHITRQYVQGHISRLCNSDDWTSYGLPGEITLSNVRHIPFYSLDFGVSLGRVENIDVPEHRVPGIGWIMPARFEGAPWEVRIALEPKIMEGVQMDRLMKWLCAKQMPKL